MNDKDIYEMKAIPVPSKFMEFLRRNPVFAQEGGKCMMNGKKDMTPEHLAQFLHYQEDKPIMKEFIEHALKSTVLDVGETDKEGMDLLKKKMGQRLVTTEVAVEKIPNPNLN